MIEATAAPNVSSESSTPNSAIVGLVSCQRLRKLLTWPMKTPRRPTGRRPACQSLTCLALAKNDIRREGPSVDRVVSSR